ncbi:50S ribosomal protein L17 [Candidatus Gottesmanbacteria bacterium RBG_13_37_7]|uniref:50S ribosomal protein L17 n=1 Tax=Candidatus Gottesmanbacteria bacterium RBG_13_37_7 TaxID=1798369 RepID=A0A1F5YJQ9_9BACT|nr:MAG: 50S ribosomal protein L17 [Candidatus Gottesmanbacteria bacterium RBG_13_37_7]
MRHKVHGKKLNRNTKSRKALFKSLINALIINGKIKTTVAKGKAIRGIVEKLVTLAKDKSTGANHKLISFLKKRELIEKFRNTVSLRFTDKIGGYLRLMRLGKRKSDHAEEVILGWSSEEKKEQINDIKKMVKTEKKKTKKTVSEKPKKS